MPMTRDDTNRLFDELLVEWGHQRETHGEASDEAAVVYEALNAINRLRGLLIDQGRNADAMATV